MLQEISQILYYFTNLKTDLIRGYCYTKKGYETFLLICVGLWKKILRKNRSYRITHFPVSNSFLNDNESHLFTSHKRNIFKRPHGFFESECFSYKERVAQLKHDYTRHDHRRILFFPIEHLCILLHSCFCSDLWIQIHLLIAHKASVLLHSTRSNRCITVYWTMWVA